MAGNTKLIGFLVGNCIQLERWGKTATVQLDTESMGALRAACVGELPKKPPVLDESRFPDFKAKYDFEEGRVVVFLSPEATGFLEAFLDLSMAGNPQAIARVQPWLDQLQEAIKSCRHYHSGAGEPGTEIDTVKEDKDG